MPRRADAAPLAPRPRTLAAISADVVACGDCARLRTYCQQIGVEKRKAFRDETYWARPVPGFGDPDARIVIIGLAPAAHGANRTGRIFTGDGKGGSGDFLMTALHGAGLANHPVSRTPDDGLRLRDVWITAAVRCAPPDNKPTPDEIQRCRRHLAAELGALPHARVFVALGRIAFESCRTLFEGLSIPVPVRGFGHGAAVPLGDGRTLLASYHPSRQNTHTGRLTGAMLLEVFQQARRAARAR